jgi:general secretion pathway protein M
LKQLEDISNSFKGVEKSFAIQLVVSHANYVVLANFLTQLTQNGLSIEKMELVSDAGQIKLSASVK